MGGTGTGRRGRMLAWYRALPEIDANPAGLSGGTNRAGGLRILGSTGIGESYQPVRRILGQHGYPEPESAFGRIRTEGKSRYGRTVVRRP